MCVDELIPGAAVRDGPQSSISTIYRRNVYPYALGSARPERWEFGFNRHQHRVSGSSLSLPGGGGTSRKLDFGGI
jgi:hypothetical protein